MKAKIISSGNIIDVRKPSDTEKKGGTNGGFYQIGRGRDECGSQNVYFFKEELEFIGENTETKLKEIKYGHPDFYKLLDQMADLHSRKNHDYAGTKDPLKNLKASKRIGVDPLTGVMLRLQDKWSRLESFMTSGEFLVKDESVEDTLMDNAVYSLLGIILRRESKKVAEHATTGEQEC